MFRIFVLLTVSVSLISTHTVNYHVDPEGDSNIIDCVEKAMESLMESTCLFFRQSAREEASVTFKESDHCSFQKTNATVHLNSECVNDDACFQLIGSVLDVHMPKDHIVRHLNLNYNCTDKCTNECLYGGEIQDDCSCKCQYGFKGENCEQLTKQASFSDASCGIVKAESSSSLSLSTYPSPRPATTFCQWLIKSSDPWSVIDAEIVEHGLDNMDISPGTTCNDRLTVYGTEDINAPIPCDNSANITKLHSTKNWLLIELRSNPYSDHAFKGPNIKYTVRKQQPGVRAFSEGMTASSSVWQLTTSAIVLTLARFF